MSVTRTRLAKDQVDTSELEKTRRHQSNVRILEYWGSASIFAYFTLRGMRALAEGYSRFVFFPLMAAFSFYDMAMAWKQAYLERQLEGDVKRSTLGYAVVQTAVFAAITAAIIGGLAAAALFVVATPALLVGGIGLKALWDLGMAAYHYKQSRKPINAATEEERLLQIDERLASHKAATESLVSGLVASAITVSIALLTWTGLPLIYGLAVGFGASLVGATLTALRKKENSQVDVIQESQESPGVELSSTASVHHKLSIKYGLEPVPVVHTVPATAVTVTTASPGLTLISSSTQSAASTTTQPEHEESISSIRATR